MANLDLSDALRMANEDKEFSAEFMANPEKFKTAFNLTDEQIRQVKQTNIALAKLKDVVQPEGGGGY